MSNSLAVHDLIANDDESSSLHDLLYFDPEAEINRLDQLEYYMGMDRGKLVHSFPGGGILKGIHALNICFYAHIINLKARQSLIEAFSDGLWILLPETDIILALTNTFLRTTTWTSVPALIAKTYNYRLFYLEEKLTIKDAAGRTCISGTTILTSTIHPCLTILAAKRFFRGTRLGDGEPWTDHELRDRKEWLIDIINTLWCVAQTDTSLPLSFYNTDLSLNRIRPLPLTYLDDSPSTLAKGGMVERRRYAEDE